MIDDPNLGLLQKMLDAASLRHRVVANNIANVNTPGYQRRVVHFREQLAQAIAGGDTARIAELRPEIQVSSAGPTRPDGNNVTLERELADLMKNALVYKTCTQLLSARIASYRAAITGHSMRA